MLKIKDNVDLKQLEKFGFKKYNCFGEHYAIQSKEYCTLVSINLENRIIAFRTTDYRLNEMVEISKILYDLIQAGLVEKIEE